MVCKHLRPTQASSHFINSGRMHPEVFPVCTNKSGRIVNIFRDGHTCFDVWLYFCFLSFYTYYISLVYAESGSTISSCKEEADKGHQSQSSLPQMSSSLMQSLHLLPVRRDGPKQSSIDGWLPYWSVMHIGVYCDLIKMYLHSQLKIPLLAYVNWMVVDHRIRGPGRGVMGALPLTTKAEESCTECHGAPEIQTGAEVDSFGSVEPDWRTSWFRFSFVGGRRLYVLCILYVHAPHVWVYFLFLFVSGSLMGPMLCLWVASVAGLAVMQSLKIFPAS